jgi:hypothetical protein
MLEKSSLSILIFLFFLFLLQLLILIQGSHIGTFFAAIGLIIHPHRLALDFVSAGCAIHLAHLLNHVHTNASALVNNRKQSVFSLSYLLKRRFASPVAKFRRINIYFPSACQENSCATGNYFKALENQQDHQFSEIHNFLYTGHGHQIIEGQEVFF